MFKRRGLLAYFFISLTLAVTAHLVCHYLSLPLPVPILASLRWLPLIIYFLYAAEKKKLTTWIFLSMLAGVEFGFDFPLVAKEIGRAHV